MTLRPRDILDPGDALRVILPHYAPRPAQIEMAEAVHDAIGSGRHLFVEAGTGTGKTLAYLIPAVLSGLRVVVSTATKTLQDQLFEKDIPNLSRVMRSYGLPFRAALMKGLSNYLCLRRLDEARRGESAGRLSGLVSWRERTATGDRAELDFLDEKDPAWLAVQSSAETRLGARCRFYEDCFVTRMKREAEDAHIVVVNHHLLLADLLVRGTESAGHASVIPPYDLLIVDEAHQLEDVATNFFGTRVSSARVEALARDVDHFVASTGLFGDAATHKEPLALSVARVRLAGTRFFDDLLALDLPEIRAEARAFLPHRILTEQLREPLEGFLHAIETLRLLLADIPTVEQAILLERRAKSLATDLAELCTFTGLSDPRDGTQSVLWVETRARSAAIGRSPVDVADRLRDELFSRVPSVICTSATLATGSSCKFARARLGAPSDTMELIVPSPFRYPECALLYVPTDLPAPRQGEVDEGTISRIVDLIELSDGGAFVLCTSTQRMRSIYDGILRRMSRPVLLQGSKSKGALLEGFRASYTAVLVATMSFWEGVDVPGRALRNVIIDKIPFAVPTDPVVQARCERIDAEGGSSFAQYMIPSAILLLKQGFGRLIRSETDYGMVSLLDSRLSAKGYGRTILKALPPARRTSDLDDLRLAWRELQSTWAESIR